MLSNITENETAEGTIEITVSAYGAFGGIKVANCRSS